jgi:hypothetical protein
MRLNLVFKSLCNISRRCWLVRFLTKFARSCRSSGLITTRNLRTNLCGGETSNYLLWSKCHKHILCGGPANLFRRPAGRDAVSFSSRTKTRPRDQSGIEKDSSMPLLRWTRGAGQQCDRPRANLHDSILNHASVVHDIAAHNREYRANFFQGLVGDGEVVVTEHDKIGQLARLDGSDLILFAQEPTIVGCV